MYDSERPASPKRALSGLPFDQVMNSHMARRLVAALLGPLVMMAAGCSRPEPNGSMAPWTDPALATRGPATRGATQVNHPPQTLLPASLPSVFVPTCVNAPPGWLGTELARPKVVTVVQPTFSAGERDGAAFGYLDRSYASCGEGIALHLSSSAPVDATVEAIRVGAYAGRHNGRVVWASGAVHVEHALGTPTHGRVSEIDHWPTRLVIRPTANWPPGAYVLKVSTRGRPEAHSYVPLRILSSGERAPYLAVSSDLTELAYDTWGGRSLYRGSGSTIDARRRDRAYVACAARPVDGSGLRQYFTMDLPLATFADRHRLTLDWTTDMSLGADPSQVTGRSALILPGHSEYWTTRSYDTLEVAQGHGTNLMVLGGNEVYWHARVTRDPQGRVSAMTVVRSAANDVRAAPADKTVKWSEPPLNRDQAKVTGLNTVAVGVHGDGRVVAAPTWLLAGTGLRVGSSLPFVFGNEADGPERRGGSSPANLQVILDTHAVDGRHHVEHITSAFFTAASGAGVFNAGTTEWLCAIVGACADGPRAATTRAALDRITLNAFTAFASPRAGRRNPSHAGRSRT